MKHLILPLMIIFSSIAAFSYDSPLKFKNGECFNYTDATTKEKNGFMVGQVEDFNLGTFSYEGTLYVKKTSTRKDKRKLVTFHFELPLPKQEKYSKVTCPKEIPKFKKKD